MALRIGGYNAGLVNRAGDQRRLDQLHRQLASGRAINSAGDDPAGLVLSEQMRAQLGGLDQATRNADTAISFARTAEGALSETSDLLGRARELVLAQAQGGTLDDRQEGANQAELANIRDGLDRISTTSQFGTQDLFDGEERRFQIGANADQQVSLTLQAVDSESLGISDLASASPDNAGDLLTRLDEAISSVADQRGAIGAFESNTLVTSRESLTETRINLGGSESLIRDADIAEVAAARAQELVRSKASIAMLAQGNQLQGRVLSLLA